MSVMLAELYDALKGAGAPEDLARKAAEAVASYENRFANFELKIERIEGRINLLTWMVGTNTVLTLSVLALLLRQ
jgi:hypothetical protein